MIKNSLCRALGILEIDILAVEKFPDPIPPPQEANKVRENRLSDLIRSSFKGIAIRSFIVISEAVLAFIFGSASLFMDALSTGLDIAASFALIISFKFASRPPDKNHPFGHGRFEPLAGFQLGLILAALGLWMLFYNTSKAAYNGSDAALPGYLWIVPGIAVLLLEFSYRLLMRTAKEQNSPALAADAAHYRADSVTSILAMLALLCASFLPQYSYIFDHVGGAFIALFMIGIGCNAAWTNMHQILDRIPSKEYFERIRGAAKKASGVLGTEKIRMQLFGPDAYVGVDIEVDPKLSVEVAHQISQQVRFEIQKELPEAREVIVHIEPYYPNDHHDKNY